MKLPHLHPCSACPRYHPPIPGDGPVPSRIMVIGDSPTRRELESQRRDRNGLGTVLVGDSGSEYTNQYLPLAGLTRSQVHTTNLAKCADKSFDSPTPERVSTCAEFHLHSELRTVQPKMIITLGAVVLHTLFPGHDLELEHGIPFYSGWGAWKGVVVPMYHPAMGLHQAGRFMTLMRGDWTHLRDVIAAGMRHTEDLYPNPDYRECRTSQDVVDYLGGRDLYDLAMDTEVESLRTLKPYCMSFSHYPGTARVIRAKSRDALDTLNYYSQGARIILHNAGFDPPVLHRMGIEVRPGRFADTMMMAYHLGDVQQSLKVLAYRLCGMRMRQFEEVAGPHSKLVVQEWLANAYLKIHQGPCYPYAGTGRPLTMPVPGPTEVSVKKVTRNRLWKEALTALGDDLLIYRGAPASCRQEDADYLPSFIKFVNGLKTGHEKTIQRISSLMEALTTSPEATDPWDRFSNWSDEVQDDIVGAAGWMPDLSLVHVPWDEALHYSARDADATIRVLPILRQRLAGRGRETL